MASELLLPQTIPEAPPLQPPVYQPLIYPFGIPVSAPVGKLTDAQARNAPNVVGAVGSSPIVQVNADPGFLAELLPRLEGLGITLGAAAVAFAMIDPSGFQQATKAIFTVILKTGVAVWPSVDSGIQNFFDAIGGVIDDELGLSSTTNGFHWWCIFGGANAAIPWCRATPWYCMGPLGWLSENCRGKSGQAGSFGNDLDDMESFLENKEQEYQQDIEDFLQSDIIDPLESFIESDVVDPIESVVKDAIKPLQEAFSSVESLLSDIESDIPSI